jgi:chitinase
VIGYYEAWRAEGTACGLMRPEEIPVEYLTQVNLAFFYIDPVHLVITDMDEPLTKDLYARVADVKTRNPDVKVWLSVGGWTFNDPGPFQSVFTLLAADTSKVEYFATTVMGFMDRFGFDGVDLDWEYPGADDRGGRPEDVFSFPRMMDILQTYLQGPNRYSKKFGLSITIPTSYWYLKWFDLWALEPYVDEFNLMAYDLHGTWDELNPIGPYVLAHTNLTEIEQALDLFWRNKVSPSKIVLGLAVCPLVSFLDSTPSVPC